MDGQKPGTGSTSPFGDGKGATSAAGGSTGVHDFVSNPASAAPKTGGRDFTKESCDQSSGTDETLNPDTVVPGGRILKADPPAGSQRTSPVGLPEGGRKPFTLRGA
jgi:hypothetical protein